MNLDEYIINFSAFSVKNAGSGGGNPWHDEKGMFTTGPSSAMGSFGKDAEKAYKKYGSPFDTKKDKMFSLLSREDKKFQQAHSILHLASDNMYQTCNHYHDKIRDNYGTKQNHKSFVKRVSNESHKIKFLSDKIANLSMQPSGTKNTQEINQRIKQIDSMVQKVKKNVEIGDKLLESFKAEIKRGSVKSSDEINSMTYANEAAHASVAALNTLKYIASSLIEK